MKTRAVFSPLYVGRPGGRRGGAWPYLAYIPAYLLLDWVSYLHPMQPYDMTPWNPQPALAVALVMFRGLLCLPLLWAVAMAGTWLFVGTPVSSPVNWLGSLVLCAGWTAMGIAFRGRLRIGARLDTGRDLLRLLVGVAVVTLATGIVYLGALALAEPGSGGFEASLLFRFWVAYSAGTLVTLPLVLMLADAGRRAEMLDILRRGETLAQAAAIAVAMWLAFAGSESEHFKYFYLLFLPLIWIASRAGLIGAAWAVSVIQVGVVVIAELADKRAISVFELQALLFALALTGFFLGVTTEERERAAREVRRTMRLAAAGEMAAAVAHELNQPLTALLTYARASELLADPDAGNRATLRATLGKLGVEARRAADVVQRLRDFFRGGEMRLEASRLPALVDSVLASFANESAAAGVTLTAQTDGRVEDVLLDRIQIEIVLRNLVRNALDAMADSGPAARRVEVRVSHGESGGVQVTVRDTGPGISEDEAQRLGEPFVTTKASGMGMGLAISRSIVEAHGGRMWIEPGPCGVVCFSLP